MQPMRIVQYWLEENANSEHYLFTLQDLRALCPDLSNLSFKTLLSRSVRAGYLIRICRNIYAYKKAIPVTGLLLFHTAALLRANEFNYISLETVLSDAGVISQIPTNWITLMSSGRSNIISCGAFGTIEFVHTKQKPREVMTQLFYNTACRLWQAKIPLALRDMKATHRDRGLIDWDTVNELI